MKALGGLLVIAGIGYVSHRKADDAPELIQAAGNRPSFGSYDCTADCSGHKAGYDWADEQGIDDEDDCDNLSTNSDSFKEDVRHMSTEMTGTMIDLKMIHPIRLE
jgi:hypothetical protein